MIALAGYARRGATADALTLYSDALTLYSDALTLAADANLSFPEH